MMRIVLFLLVMTRGFSASSQVELTEKILMSTELKTEFLFDPKIEVKYDTAARKPVSYPENGIVEVIDFPDLEVSLSDWTKSLEDEIQKNFKASTKKLFKSCRRKKAVVIQFEFNVNKEDELHSLVVLDNDHPEVSTEIARILKTLKWRSGESEGRRVNSLCTLSVVFTRRFQKGK